MSRPLRALFVTYSFFWGASPAWTTPKTPNVIGVLKRCLRLLKHLPPGAVEPLWVHYGNFDPNDPLVREMTPLIPRYDPRTSGPLRASPRVVEAFFRKRTLVRLLVLVLVGLADRVRLRRPRPEETATELVLKGLDLDVVVFGENPLTGPMQLISRDAHALGIPQVAIDNDLSRDQIEALHRSAPEVDAWFLLGLGMADPASPGPCPAVTAPPLLAARGNGGGEAALTILGYEPHVALAGARFLHACPAGTVGRLVAPPLRPAHRRACERAAAPAPLTFVESPDEHAYRALLESSRVVFCKNGFQQIVESLAVGTPVVAVQMSGGVEGFTLAEAMTRHVRFVTGARAGWDEALAATRRWLVSRPPMPWTAEIAALDSPVRESAERFLELLQAVAARPAKGRACSPAS